MPETVHLTQQVKDQLVRVKRDTGIKNWNSLCRWALCLSLADGRPVVLGANDAIRSNVEISWQVLTGEQSATYLALLRMSEHALNQHGHVTLQQVLYAHLERGATLLLSRTQELGGLKGLVATPY